MKDDVAAAIGESNNLVKEGVNITYATSNEIRKHYRYMLNTTLEESAFMETDVFDEVQVTQYRRFNDDDLFTDMVIG